MRTVNRVHTSRPTRFLRAAALFLALIVLGISSGTTLTHTGDLGITHCRAGAQTLAHAVPQGADTCMACQWENSLFSLQVPAVPLPIPVFTLLPVLTAGVRTQFGTPFDHTLPRAPPCAA